MNMLQFVAFLSGVQLKLQLKANRPHPCNKQHGMIMTDATKCIISLLRGRQL